jgi:malate synthase
MRAYALLLVKTCHRRGAPAMGGMAAKVSKELFRTLLAEELPKVRLHLGEQAWKAGKYESAAQLFDRITTDDRYVEFLTLPAYDYVA